MKRTILFSIIAIAAMTSAQAQQIQVVSPDGQTTTLYSDLNMAIISAEAGSFIYLPGGTMSIDNATAFNKPLHIIGIGHYLGDNDNSNTPTTINGNLSFIEGSDGSSVQGIYLSGNVTIGTQEAAVSSFLLQYCNINSFQIGNSYCNSIMINQNYIRSNSNGGDSPLSLTNNIISGIQHINNGTVEHNIITDYATIITSTCWGRDAYFKCYYLAYITNSTIHDNIHLLIANNDVGDNKCNMSTENRYYARIYRCEGSSVKNNITVGDTFGDNPLQASSSNVLFVGPINGISTASDFHLKEGSIGINAGTDGSDIGIYGGSGFKNILTPAVPTIISAVIAKQTDAAGKLKVSVKVSVE